MSDTNLVEDLKCSAARRPDGWTMAAVIRKAERLTKERDELAANNARLRDVITDIHDALCGQGFEILGWHLNGDTELIDNWFDENHWLQALAETPAQSVAYYKAEGLKIAVGELRKHKEFCLQQCEDEKRACAEHGMDEPDLEYFQGGITACNIVLQALAKEVKG